METNGKPEFIYRFRSGKHMEDELIKSTIFCAPLEKLNDPMEGLKNIYFRGDRITWKNLFRNYVRSLYNAIELSYIAGSNYDPAVPLRWFTDTEWYDRIKEEEWFKDIRNRTML